MKPAALLLFAIVAGNVPGARGQAFDARHLFKQANPHIVTIVACDEYGNPLGQGSGFFLSSGDLVTSHHVLAGMPRAYVYDANDHRDEILSVVADDEQRDLIKVRTSHPPSGPGLPLAKELPEEGEIIVAIGSPKGLNGTISEGIVSAIRRDANMPRIIQTTAATSPGSSGCPLLNTHGAVVGIVETKWTDAENVTFATPVHYLATMDDQTPMPLAQWAKNNPSQEQLSFDWSRGQGPDNPSELPGEGLPDMPRDAERRAAVLFEEGSARFAQHDVRGAYTFFERATRVDSTHGPTWFMLGTCLYALRNPAAAVRAYEHAATLLFGHVDEAKTFDILLGLAQSYFAIPRRDSALKYYRQALMFDPDNPLVLVGAGRSSMDLGDDSGAYAYFARAASSHAGISEPHYYLGMIDLGWARTTDAAKEMATAISLQPDEPLYAVGLGQVQIREGDTTEAERNFRKALMLYSERYRVSDMEDIVVLGRQLESLGMTHEVMLASSLLRELESQEYTK